MNFNRAKTIFIFIFIFVNLFLFSIYKYQTIEKDKISKENVVKILANNDITISSKTIGDFVRKLDGIEVHNLINEKEEILSSFLGSSYETVSDTYYKTNTKSLSFNGAIIEYIDHNSLDKNFNGANELNIGNKAVDKLHKMGVGNSALSVYSVYKNTNNIYYITLAYKYKDLTIFNHNLYVFANEQGVSSLNGSILFCSMVQNLNYSIVPAESILMEFPENEDIKKDGPMTITSVNLGYYIPVDQFNVSSYAIPSYEIKTSSGKTFYFDARKGISREIRLLGTRKELK